ncbi:metal-sensing transcriptional repressor [Sulfobacillus harzensis]|uniref:Copper-sensing transcriptional repressor CsoR n=1 Tax=Sulfobacillus harzensis TaxID=2729629 RepID=A0A7Y0L4X4_9FIRM|nr:metal-sensitive transcriptional regulator [Sulfobacillus harzensis]
MIPEYKQDASHRLRAAIGHLKAVSAMVDDERYCVDIMKQLAAVQASLEGVQQVLLKNHLSTCVTDAILAGSGESLITELVSALRYSKGIPSMEPAGRAGTTPHPHCGSGETVPGTVEGGTA